MRVSEIELTLNPQPLQLRSDSVPLRHAFLYFYCDYKSIRKKRRRLLFASAQARDAREAKHRVEFRQSTRKASKAVSRNEVF